MNDHNLIPAKKGEVRNPNGRPKGALHRRTLWREAFEGDLQVDGQPFNAMVLLAQAIKLAMGYKKQVFYRGEMAEVEVPGDVKAVIYLLEELKQYMAKEEVEESNVEAKTITISSPIYDQINKAYEKYKESLNKNETNADQLRVQDRPETSTTKSDISTG